ncbi:MAG: secretin N-terminal domain-containing protein [Candidatus Wallbacteria bacterium]|nr:secretin N-terminal domain-containing protein [Candidatus Wallbacteria bacterium]
MRTIIALLLLFIQCASAEDLPAVLHGKLVELGKSYTRTSAGNSGILERVKTILAKKGIAESEYRIELYPESVDVLIRAKNDKIRDEVYYTFHDVEIYYFGSVQTRTFTLQYASAKDVAATLSNIYAPLSFSQQDGKTVIRRQDAQNDVSADLRTNSLVVTAPPCVMDGIRETILALDRRTTQVMIKVLIAEVSLDESSQFGIEWNMLDSSLFGGEKETTNTKIDFGNQTQDKQDELMGLKYSILREDKMRAMLQALQSSSRIDVLSSPQLVTANNNQAYFEETVKVPVENTTTTATGVINTSIDYQEIGIKLNVRPQVNPDENIMLDVEQTIQNILTFTNVQNAPTFSNRVVKTKVLARDGHTVVIGGLLKDNVTINRKKVPLLGDLPLVKDAFRRNTRETSKTELMVFITPQIFKTDMKMEEVIPKLHTPELKEKLSKISDDFLTIRESEGPREFYVIDVNGDELLLNLRKSDEVRIGSEFRVVRPGQQYFDQKTNRMVTGEEQKIARIKIMSIRESTSLASVIFVMEGEKIQKGDRVRRPDDSNFAFSEFKVQELEIKLDLRLDSTAKLIAVLKLKNISSFPAMKTEEQEGTSGEVNLSIKKGEEWIPLKTVRTSPAEDSYKGMIYFNRWIQPGEEFSMKIEYVAAAGAFCNVKEKCLTEIKDLSSFDPFEMNFGPYSDDCKVNVVIHNPGELLVRDFDFKPFVMTHSDKTTSLIWTHIGAPLRIKGKTRFKDPQAVLKNLLEQ